MYFNRCVSVSQDLIDGGICFGDTLNIANNNLLLSGLWIVEDCMAPEMHQHLDFLVSRSELKLFPQGVYRVKIIEIKPKKGR